MPAQPRIRLIAGLGNPEEQHVQTRHNAGFWFANAVAVQRGAVFRYQERFQGEVAHFSFEDEKVWLLKPQTYMNRSGQSLHAFAQFYKIPVQQLLVAHDEIDLPSGTARIKHAGGHGGHNGLRSTFEHLGPDFVRLRLGVGHPGHRDDVTDHVLKKPGAEERREIDSAIDRALDALDEVLRGDVEAAMRQLHTRASHGV